MMARTVSDFRNMFFLRAGVGIDDYEEFISQSIHHVEFWHKLNSIGGRRIRELPPEVVPDIDVTATLSDEEWTQLERELEKLL